MSFVVLAFGYSGLALLAALRRQPGAIPVGVAVLDTTSARATRNHSALRQCEILVAASVAEGRQIATTRSGSQSPVLSLFWPGAEDFEVPVIDVSAYGDGTVRSGEPLQWALADGSRSLTLRVERFNVDGHAESRCHHALALPPGEDLQGAAQSAAGLLWPCLGSRCEPPAEADGHPQAPADRRRVAERLAPPSRLNWQWPADRIAGLIRANGPPAPGAWTSWRDVQVYVTSATPTRDVGGPVPAGTVLETSPAGVLVATVDGAIRLTGLRDIIGPVDPALITCGDVLGGDPAEDIERLERRVRDLECIVQRLTAGIDLLSPAPLSHGFLKQL